MQVELEVELEVVSVELFVDSVVDLLLSLFGLSFGSVFGESSGSTFSPVSFGLVFFEPHSHLRKDGHFELDPDVDGLIGSEI